ncbi:MAG: response regulator [Nitrospiraceae bacterium]
MPTILVAINDIFFYTKVRDALLPHGYKLERARTQDDVGTKTAAEKPDAIVMDMNEQRLDPFKALTQIKADPTLAKTPVLVFANHEEVDTWQRAKALGVSKIVSRNEFSSRTKDLVEELLPRR